MVIVFGYPIDAAKFIDHNLESDVSEEPVESGAPITDHVQNRPDRVTIEGFVSDTPIGAMIARRQELLLVDGEAFALPSDEAFAHLQLIHKKREPGTIETPRRTYRNMVLRSLSVPEDAGTGDALMFRAEFVQVRIVENERTVVRVAVPRAQNKVNRGHKASEQKGDPPPSYLLRDDPPVGANSGGRKLLRSGGDGVRTPIASGGDVPRTPIASGGSGL